MRLNDGLPVWHVSASLHTPQEQPLAAPSRLERAAVQLLRGVGGDVEWWLWNRSARIAHLRVAITDVEFASMPAGCATVDAGPEGVKRRRSR